MRQQLWLDSRISAYSVPIKRPHPVPCVTPSKHGPAIFAGTDEEVTVRSVLTARGPDVEPTQVTQPRDLMDATR